LPLVRKNIDSNIGWKELSAISKLTHTELQFLFDKYKQTTPMTYIRKQKEQNKKVQPVYTITKNFLAKPRE
jgi:AraC-like DNA-binding protein